MKNSIERLPYVFTLKDGFIHVVSNDTMEYNLLLINNHIILESIGRKKDNTYLIKKCRTSEKAKKEFDKYNRWFNEAKDGLKKRYDDFMQGLKVSINKKTGIIDIDIDIDIG